MTPTAMAMTAAEWRRKKGTVDGSVHDFTHHFNWKCSASLPVAEVAGCACRHDFSDHLLNGVNPRR